MNNGIGEYCLELSSLVKLYIELETSAKVLLGPREYKIPTTDKLLTIIGH